MEFVLLAAIVWVIVFLLIPVKRIRELIMVPIIAFIWMTIVDNVSVALGYYRYWNIVAPIGSTSFFQCLAAAGAGLLMVNWLTENPLSKLASSLFMSVVVATMEYIYIKLGAFAYGRFDVIISFIHSLAVFSILIWVALAIVGPEKVYTGIRSRFQTKQFAHR